MDGSLPHGGHGASTGAAPLRAAGVTLALGLALVAMKAWAWVATGFSVAVLAALLDSAVDVAVSAMTMGAIVYAARPPDAGHRYGHGKIDGVAALAQAALIAAAALFLVYESASRLFSRPEVTEPLAAAAVMAASTVLAIVIVVVQRRAVARDPSLALEADTAHYLSDLALNAGVIATLLATWVGAPPWVDALFGVAVAAWIARTAWGVGGKALAMLLDAELPDADRARIEAIVRAHPDVRALHDLRTRRAGAREVVAVDIELNPELTLAAAHAIGVEVEAQILAAFPRAEAMLHFDPHGVPHTDSRH